MGLKKQISKFDSKIGYFGGPNKALANPCFKRPNWSHLGRTGWEKERRRRKEEEEEKKRRSGDQAKQAKGMELWILYGSHGIVSFICLNACLQI